MFFTVYWWLVMAGRTSHERTLERHEENRGDPTGPQKPWAMPPAPVDYGVTSRNRRRITLGWGLCLNPGGGCSWFFFVLVSFCCPPIHETVPPNISSFVHRWCNPQAMPTSKSTELHANKITVGYYPPIMNHTRKNHTWSYQPTIKQRLH